MKKFYITTAIDYPNGKPHIGHAYEKVVTDAYARWYRNENNKVHFLTGTDENGQKLIESAKAEKKDVRNFVDQNVEIFKNLCRQLNISNDDFIRTTEDRHIETCQRLWNSIEKNGFLEEGHYSGKYCLSCESFYTELQAPDGNCPVHHIPMQLKEEKGIFFKLSSLNDWILEHLKNNPRFVVPQAKYNEIFSRVQQDGLRDLAITRPNEGWGVPVPGHDEYVMYTWFDALINYYSALDQNNSFWPCDVHVIGKDILWFHAVIWPCLLKAANIELPKQIYVHGMILAEDGKKMSKSLGNTVDPFDLLKRFPVDSIRYYFLRTMPSQQDGRFSEKDLIDRHNNELGNDFGNLIMRVVKLAQKVLPGVVGPSAIQDINLSICHTEMSQLMDQREHDKAFDRLWKEVQYVNQYVNDQAPWKLKDDHEKFTHVVANCLHAIEAIAFLLRPFMPEVAPESVRSLGIELGQSYPVFGKTYTLSTPLPLFPKLEMAIN